MKKVRFVLPALAFLFAIAAAFAGTVAPSSILEEPTRTDALCESCTDNVDNNCDQSGQDRCRCTFLSEVVSAKNESCQVLYRD